MNEIATTGRTDTDRYYLARDAEIMAKFVARVTAHEAALAIYRLNPDTAKFPRPIAKNAKYDAYEAAGRVERMLGLTTRANTVPELAARAGDALTAARAR